MDVSMLFRPSEAMAHYNETMRAYLKDLRAKVCALQKIHKPYPESAADDLRRVSRSHGLNLVVQSFRVDGEEELSRQLSLAGRHCALSLPTLSYSDFEYDLEALSTFCDNFLEVVDGGGEKADRKRAEGLAFQFADRAFQDLDHEVVGFDPTARYLLGSIPNVEMDRIAKQRGSNKSRLPEQIKLSNYDHGRYQANRDNVAAVRRLIDWHFNYQLLTSASPHHPLPMRLSQRKAIVTGVMNSETVTRNALTGEMIPVPVIHWDGHWLKTRSGELPEAILDGLAGRPLSAAVDVPIISQLGLAITKAEFNRGNLFITTDAHEMKNLDVKIISHQKENASLPAKQKPEGRRFG